MLSIPIHSYDKDIEYLLIESIKELSSGQFDFTIVEPKKWYYKAVLDSPAVIWIAALKEKDWFAGLLTREYNGKRILVYNSNNLRYFTQHYTHKLCAPSEGLSEKIYRILRG